MVGGLVCIRGAVRVVVACARFASVLARLCGGTGPWNPSFVLLILGVHIFLKNIHT
jgi:hypothetical protein